MPNTACQESRSNILFQTTQDDRLVNFSIRKMACGSPLEGETGFKEYCHGKKLAEILSFSYAQLIESLGLEGEEKQFILYLEWDALRSAIAQYLGVEAEGVDHERCRITSIRHYEDGSEISEVLLPPTNLPEILPGCYRNQ